MKRKTFNLVSACVGSVSAIAIAVVTYLEPSYTEAINASISVATTAIVTICGNFVKDNDETQNIVKL